TDGNGGNDIIYLNAEGRHVRMLGLTRFTRYGFSLWEFEVYGAPTDVNLALAKPASASSNENASLMASMAFDGSTNSRWSSSFADNQWLAVDLGSTHQINRVKLSWQNSYGREYLLQTSNDGETWTTIFSEANGNGGIDDVAVNGVGRYLRMF